MIKQIEMIKEIVFNCECSIVKTEFCYSPLMNVDFYLVVFFGLEVK